MRSNKLIAGLASLLMVTTVGFIGTSGANAAPKVDIPKGPIIIGLPIGLTSFINFYDSQLLLGAQTEADILNAKGGILGHKIKLVTADTGSNIAQGGPAAQAVIAKGAQFILPTVDYNFGGVAAGVGQAKNLIVMSAADDPRFGLSIGKNVFNFGTTGGNAGSILAEYATKTLKKSKAYLVLDTTLAAMSANCDGFTDAFKHFGGTITGNTSYDGTAASQTSAISAVQAASSTYDVIMLCGYPAPGAIVLKGIRASGVTTPTMLTDAFDGNFWQEGVPDLSNSYAISYGVATAGQGRGIASETLDITRKNGKPAALSLGYLTGF
ncbi:MAG: ABC transporter substrate-binding protein, partial [Actinobacteria bacterium]|nr:ABC transporter substrate-binding protein [Actinomycetota bacterium]